MTTFGQQLKASNLEQYLATLAALTHRVGAFQDWHQQHTALWTEACMTLGLSAQPTSEQVQTALCQRLTQLEDIVQQCLGGLDWNELVVYIQPFLPAETKHGYFLKPDRLQLALQQHPPERTLAYLGYDSLDQYIQTESLYELLAALRFAESPQWMQTHLQFFQDIQPADFEYRAVQFLRLAPERWWALAEPFATKKKHHFSHLKEAGVIFYYPAPLSASAPTRQPLHVTLLLLLHYVFEVHFYAQWFEQQLFRLNQIGEYFTHTLAGDDTICASDQRHVPIVQQYHLKLPQPNPCAFEPHVMSEALHWQKAAGVFFDLVRAHSQFPQVAFWEKCYTVGQWQQDRFINFNLMDNMFSVTHWSTDWWDYHFREDVWNGIFAAYTSPAQLEQLILDHFSTKQIDLTVLKTL